MSDIFDQGMNEPFNLPRRGEWRGEINQEDEAVLQRLRESLTTLIHWSELIKFKPGALSLEVQVSYYAGKKKEKMFVKIDPYSLAQYFLGSVTLTDIFTQSGLSDAMMERSINEWVESVIAALAQAIDPSGKDYIEDEETRAYLGTIHEFMIVHRYQFRPRVNGGEA